MRHPDWMWRLRNVPIQEMTKASTVRRARISSARRSDTLECSTCPTVRIHCPASFQIRTVVITPSKKKSGNACTLLKLPTSSSCHALGPIQTFDLSFLAPLERAAIRRHSRLTFFHPVHDIQTKMHSSCQEYFSHYFWTHSAIWSL